MDKFAPKPVSLAGLLVSGVTILGGFVVCLVIVVLFSQTPELHLLVVAAAFGLIVLVPIRSLREPKAPAEEPAQPWPRLRRLARRRRRRRRRQTGQLTRTRMWKRKKGQDHHQPWGARELPKPATTFVRAPRRPTEP